MQLMDLLLLAIKNLWRHKIRTILTITGVTIGASSIVIMISLGLAMNKNFETQASQMGSLTMIQINNWNMGGKTPEGKDIPVLDDAVLNKIAKMKGVEIVTPLMDLQLKVMAGKYISYLQVFGVKAEALPALGIKLQDGEFFTDKETNVLVVNSELKRSFYVPNPRRYEPAPEDFDLMKQKITLSVDMQYGEKPQPGVTPVKQKVKAKPFKVRISGITAMAGGQYDYNTFMPLEQVKALKIEQDKFNKANSGGTSGGGGIYMDKGMYAGGGTGTQKGYTQAIVKVKDMNSVTPVYEAIKAMGYEAYSPIQMIEDMKKQSSGLRSILLVIGIMALLIAAIGIANTMYMSIYERTREIGIIKVIGARLGDIMKLFMVEAAWIGVFGGLFGVLFSLGASYIMNHLNLSILGANTMWGPSGETKLPISLIPLWLMGVAFGISVMASLLAGLFPSIRAMKLSVMKALRQD
jgi:putative ABC transport system permease protein